MFVDHQFLVDGFGRLLTSENTGPNDDDDDDFQSIQTDKGLNTQQDDEVPESESGAKRRVGGATAGIKLGLSSRAHPPPNKTSPSSVLGLSSSSSNASAWARAVGDGNAIGCGGVVVRVLTSLWFRQYGGRTFEGSHQIFYRGGGRLTRPSITGKLWMPCTSLGVTSDIDTRRPENATRSSLLQISI
jgi:hypothetical protein